MTYKEQSEEIRRLADRIAKKAKGFANDKHDGPYFGDLLHVIEDLKEIDQFLNDKYLKS